MTEAEKEANKIIEMFGSKAILHVEGIIETYTSEYSSQYKNEYTRVNVKNFWQQVKQVIENK